MTATDLLLPPPVDLGLPEKFSAWRPLQDQAVVRTVEADRRFVVAALPTGAGKSAYYMAVARLVGGRTCVLTSTKALQRQLTDDFTGMGLVEVKGQNAYPCRALTEPDRQHLEGVSGLLVRRHDGEVRQTCEDGPCHLGLTCRLRLGGCTYYDAVRVADHADLIVTNYAFWLTINAFRKRKDPLDPDAVIEGIGPVDTLVLDEAHDAPDALSSFLTITLTVQEIEATLSARVLDCQAATIAEWREWAKTQATRARTLLETTQQQVIASIGSPHGMDRTAARQVKVLRLLLRKLALLQTPDVEWVIEPVRVEGQVPPRPDVQFAPIWPAPMAEEALFRGTPRVLLVSATVRPKTLDYLGIAREDACFFEQPSTFPVARRPVSHVPTARITYTMSELAERTWLTRIDQVIRMRPGVRGIIQAGSYQRVRLIAERSQYRNRLLWHRSASAWGSGGRTVAEAIEEFRRRPVGDGLWLLSPAVTTGYDFPDDLCRVQIVVKIPFPDTRSELLQARQARDPDYGMYLAMQTLVQAVGRSTRSATDHSECFILDDNARWFIWKYRHFAPAWFLDAYRELAMLPPAPRWDADSSSGGENKLLT